MLVSASRRRPFIRSSTELSPLETPGTRRGRILITWDSSSGVPAAA